MKIYFDNCALGRLMDDLFQDPVRAEAEAVRAILRTIEAGVHEWVSSEMLLREVSRNPNPMKRESVEFLLRIASFTQPLTTSVTMKARSMEQSGLRFADAVHLSSALVAGCAVLVTTDYRFVRQAARLNVIPEGFVQNPIDFQAQM